MFIHFKTINVHSRNILLEYDNKYVTMDFITNFFGIILVNTLHWKQHIDAQIIKLNAACNAIRTLKLMVPQETTYGLFLFHSLTSYGIIIWAVDRRVPII